MGDLTDDDDKERWDREAIQASEVRYQPGNLYTAKPETLPPGYIDAFQDQAGFRLERATGHGEDGLWRWSTLDSTGQTAETWRSAIAGDSGMVAERELTVARVKHTGGRINVTPPSIGGTTASRLAGLGHKFWDRAESDAFRAQPEPFSPFPTPVPRPAEPEVGMVIGFAKQYSEDGTVYSFAAIRATDRVRGWYLSGPRYSGHAYTWDALLDFIGGPAEWARIGVITEWSPLGDL